MGTDEKQAIMLISIPAGRLYSVGWRPGTTHGEKVAVYAAQKVEDKHDPTHYIDLYDSQELVNVS